MCRSRIGLVEVPQKCTVKSGYDAWSLYDGSDQKVVYFAYVLKIASFDTQARWFNFSWMWLFPIDVSKVYLNLWICNFEINQFRLRYSEMASLFISAITGTINGL